MSKKTIRTFFELQLNAKHYYFSKNKSSFEGIFRGIKFKVKIEFKQLKIKEYALIVKDYQNIPKAHLNPDGKACLGIDSELKYTPLEIIVSIANWLNNFYFSINQNKKHDHGYRHGIAGVIEWKLQQLFLPYGEESIDKLLERDFLEIQKNTKRYNKMKPSFSYIKNKEKYKNFLKEIIRKETNYKE